MKKLSFRKFMAVFSTCALLTVFVPLVQAETVDAGLTVDVLLSVGLFDETYLENDITTLLGVENVEEAPGNAEFTINKETRKATLDLTIDTKICPVLDYFEIFMDRTMMSKYAAKYLNIWFELIINGTKLL